MIVQLPILSLLQDYSEAAHRASAERFVRHAHSERALPVLRRWGPWSKSSEGRSFLAQVSAIADNLLCGDITSAQYALALRQLARMTTVPQGDLEVLARHALEFCRCTFFAAGHVPTVDIEPAGYVGDA